MAFTNKNFYRLDTGYQQDYAPKLWGYQSTVDDSATVEASGYFTAQAALNVGDIIYAKTSDGYLLMYVTSDVEPVTTAALTNEVGGPYVVSNSLYTTTGGASSEDVTGNFESTDIVQATIHSIGASQHTLVEAYAGSGKVTLSFTGDPGADTQVNLTVIRG